MVYQPRRRAAHLDPSEAGQKTCLVEVAESPRWPCARRAWLLLMWMCRGSQRSFHFEEAAGVMLRLAFSGQAS